MSLYLKYRPKNFDEVLGNESIKDTLMDMVNSPENSPKSFLFTGPTGCGKTTLARIFANEIGCSGSDLREIDSGDFRGIDTVRQVREQSRFRPLDGNYRVWIIDECHKMTNDAQNAMLKILEDTPEHIFFMLCTTDPQKLIKAIKNRCSTFQVSLLQDNEMLTLLKTISRKERKRVKKEALDQIVLDAQGHVRNALQYLDQVIRVPLEKQAEIARQAEVEQSESIELCRVLLRKKIDWKSVAEVLSKIQQQDPEGIRRVVLGYCKSILIRGFNPRAALVLNFFIEPFYNSGFPGVVDACASIYMQQ